MIASKLRLFAPAGNFAASKNGEGLIAADILENLPLALKKIRNLQSLEVPK